MAARRWRGDVTVGRIGRGSGALPDPVEAAALLVLEQRPGIASSPSGAGAQGAEEATADERVRVSAAAAAELGQARRLASPPSAAGGSLPGEELKRRKKREKREEEKWSPHFLSIFIYMWDPHIFLFLFC
uniref:Uncharacterized protein n=1 Tax=Oryza meridionalis TaxID=40149 RepID=A0A0E0CKY2_9ORYZ